MRLEKASYKAIKYACLNFHYAKSVPVNPTGYSVFNNKNEWCGVILFSLGANNNLGKPYKLVSGQFAELVRMALNGKQESTSKAMSIAINLFKKHNPLCKLLISFADTRQGHKGVIYQATNWYYIETIKTTPEYFYQNRWMHQRQVNSLLGSLKKLPLGTKKRNAGERIRYVYPLNKSMIQMCKRISQPFIKCDSSITANAVADQATEGGQHYPIAQI